MLGRARDVDPEQVTRLVLCSGKIYYDLDRPRAAGREPGVAIGRVELLYPFPQAEILDAGRRATRTCDEVVWVQEEPRNMGARAHMSPRLLQILPEHLEFGYIGRPERAASGEGYPVAHAIEQNRIVSHRARRRRAGLAVPAQAARASAESAARTLGPLSGAALDPSRACVSGTLSCIRLS